MESRDAAMAGWAERKQRVFEVKHFVGGKCVNVGWCKEAAYLHSSTFLFERSKLVLCQFSLILYTKSRRRIIKEVMFIEKYLVALFKTQSHIKYVVVVPGTFTHGLAEGFVIVVYLLLHCTCGSHASKQSPRINRTQWHVP